MSDQDLREKEDAALDKTASDSSPQEQAEKDKLPGNDDQVGEGFRKEKPTGRLRNVGSNLSTYRKLGITMGVVGILVGAVIAIFSFLLPFKLTHIIETIEQRVGNVPAYAVENRLEYYMSRYLMIRTLEATAGEDFDFSVGSPDRDRFAYLGDSFFDTMYTNWKGAKLEAKMATQYGVKVTSNVNADAFTRTNKLRADRFKIEQLGAGRDSPLREQTLDRGEVRDFIKLFAREETKSRQVFKRYNMRKVMKNYYGVGNWKPFEAKRDDLSNRYYDKKRAFQKRLVNETVGRLSERYAKYMDCLLGSATSRSCRDSLKRSDPGTGLADADKRSSGIEETDGLIDDVADEGSGDSGIRKRIANQISEKLQEFGIKKTTQTLVTSAAAGLGIIDSLNSIYNTLDSGVLNQVIYDKNAQQYMAYSASLLSAADQIRSGEDFDLDDLRVAQEVFDDYDDSPVYQVGATSGGTVSAQSGISRDCDGTEGNETQLEPGETVCPEKRLVQDETSFTNSAGWQVLGSILQPYQDTVGRIVGGITAAIGSITDAIGLNSVIAGISSFFGIDELAASAFGFLLNRVAGPVVTGAEVGGDAYDSVFAAVAVQQSSVGGEVGVAKEDTIGGAYLSDIQVAAIREDQMSDYYEELGNKSFFARYFSPSVKESLTGQLALHAPTSVAGAGQQLASTIGNPASIFSSFGKLFTSRVGAQSVPETNPFHVVNMGFPMGHEVFTSNNGDGMDYDQIAGQYQCDRAVADRDQNKQFGRPDDLPFEVPTAVDPCLLEQAVVDASTRYFTGTYDEGISGVSTAPVAGSNEESVVGNTANVPCAPGTTDLGEADGYSSGQLYRIRLCAIPGFASASTEDTSGVVRVNSSASNKWLQLFQQAQAAGTTLRANSSFRSMEKQEYLYNCMVTGSCNNGNEAAKPGYSNHQIGFAVDVDIVPGSDPSLTTCQANPSRYPVYQTLISLAPAIGIEGKVQSECWHWSVGGH